MKAAIATLLAACSLASAQSQDLDVLVIVERLPDGSFEADLQVDTQEGLLNAVRFAEPGGPGEPFFSDPERPTFELAIESSSTFEQFLTEDATGESFDLQFELSTGAVSVYRFEVSDVFGPQNDIATLAGFPGDLEIDVDTEEVHWTPPALTGDFILVFGERDDGFDNEAIFVASNQIPFTPELLIQPPVELSLADSSYDLPDAALDGPLIVLLSYGDILGSFSPDHVSGPELDIGNAAGIMLSSDEARAASGGCSVADLVPPFGIVDLGDIDAFIPAFLAGDASVDFVPPAGIVDLDDLDAFIVSFLAGCP
ncbi:MAG: GC-type dockerin domain-anchored protein [Planctomycetota bacterium]